jgi:type I restriction enzyme, S subunit
MSSKTKKMAKKEKQEGKLALTPKLRFPEFRDAEGWTTETLGSVAILSTEKVGDKTCTPMSITSGVGLVSQMEKFGRIIAGSSYKNYLLLKKNDFAYNKSATKEYPEGFIVLYLGDELAAVPNSIFTCFRIKGDSPVPQYLNYLFLGNLHGRWLRKFIEVGARAHGSLSIAENDLLALPVPLPKGELSLPEQQKIAECLSSVDEVIAAQARKLDALKDHKKGLMQQLFPREGETQPRLRFPEFRTAGEWSEKSFENIIKINSGKGFKASEYSKTGIRLLQIENVGYGVTKWNENTIYLPEAYTAKHPEIVLRSGDIVLALNRPVTNGELKIAKIQEDDAPSILYQRVGKLAVLDESLRVDFAFHICRHFIKHFVINRSIGSDQPFISLRGSSGIIVDRAVVRRNENRWRR